MRRSVLMILVLLTVASCGGTASSTSEPTECPVRLGEETFDFACAVPENATETAYNELPEQAQQIENETTSATWFLIEYEDEQSTKTVLKLTPSAFPLALTFGDCGIAAATYPDQSAHWTEWCY